MIIRKSKRPNREGNCWYFEVKEILNDNRAVITVSKKYKSEEEAYREYLKFRERKLKEEL